MLDRSFDGALTIGSNLRMTVLDRHAARTDQGFWADVRDLREGAFLTVHVCARHNRRLR
jgi:hypothetical protein